MGAPSTRFLVSPSKSVGSNGLKTTHGHDSTAQVIPRQEENTTCPTAHKPSDAYGDFALAVNRSGARASASQVKLVLSTHKYEIAQTGKLRTLRECTESTVFVQYLV